MLPKKSQNYVHVVKVHIFWEGHKFFWKSPPYFWLQYIVSKVSWRFRKILWPSQNIWTLLNAPSIREGNRDSLVTLHWMKPFLKYISFMLPWTLHSGPVDILLINFSLLSWTNPKWHCIHQAWLLLFFHKQNECYDH